jgi:hypothetical protein
MSTTEKPAATPATPASLPQPTPTPQITDGATAPPAAAPTSPVAELSTAGKIEASLQTLLPLLTSIFGAEGGLGVEAAELGVGAGNIIWQLFSKHHSMLSEHKSLKAAIQAAVLHVHTRQPGVLASRKNPSTWEIHPVIQLTVSDILKHPVPVGSLAKDLDTADNDD